MIKSHLSFFCFLTENFQRCIKNNIYIQVYLVKENSMLFYRSSEFSSSTRTGSVCCCSSGGLTMVLTALQEAESLGIGKYSCKCWLYRSMSFFVNRQKMTRSNLSELTSRKSLTSLDTSWAALLFG